MIAPLSVAVGIMLLSLALWDAFSTIALPRTVSVVLRPARVFSRGGWRLWRGVGSWFSNRRTRQSFLTAFGPFSIFLLLGLWAVMILVAFALLHFGLRTQLNAPESQGGLGVFFYLSGTTFFTLGLGDVVPLNALGRALVVVEVGTGIIFLAMIIGYLPVLDQAYAQREVGVQLLESRAGSPQSAVRLLRRFGRPESAEVLATVLREAERWAAELSQSHIAHPLLVYYRSQHLEQSWLLSLTTLLDSCALLLVSRKGVPSRQARATFRMAARVAADLAGILGSVPGREASERLPAEDLPRLRAALESSGLVLPTGTDEEAKLNELRGFYEPYVLALSSWLLMPLPEWIPAVDEKEDETDLLTFADFGSSEE
ncbi:MAG: two pore domain potassium channel family protein [Deltaproteobacteria bacterium]|nr:two pore domain potassium channel family protein [Deltaproteobacteria bacterium]